MSKMSDITVSVEINRAIKPLFSKFERWLRHVFKENEIPHLSKMENYLKIESEEKRSN